MKKILVNTIKNVRIVLLDRNFNTSDVVFIYVYVNLCFTQFWADSNYFYRYSNYVNVDQSNPFIMGYWFMVY